MGPKNELLRTLVAASSTEMSGFWRSQCSSEVARPKRFELLTPRFVVWCSIQLSYGRLLRIAREMLPDQPGPAGTGLSL